MKSDDEIPSGYTRVTDILSPFNNFSGIDPETLAAAADRGTRVHKLCESYALGLFIVHVDEDCKNYFNAFCKWFDEYVEEVICAEKRLNSPTYLISGKFDLIVRLKGDKRLVLLDNKTPQTPSKTWKLQTAAYKHLILECLDKVVERRICLMLPKHGPNIRIIEHTDHDHDLELFLSALRLHRFFQS